MPGFGTINHPIRHGPRMDPVWTPYAPRMDPVWTPYGPRIIHFLQYCWCCYH